MRRPIWVDIVCILYVSHLWVALFQWANKHNITNNLSNTDVLKNLATNVSPDQALRYAAPHQDRHCLYMYMSQLWVTLFKRAKCTNFSNTEVLSNIVGPGQTSNNKLYKSNHKLCLLVTIFVVCQQPLQTIWIKMSSLIWIQTV